MYITEQVVKLIHLCKTYHLLLAPSRFKSFLETHMIQMLTSGVSPRCSIHLAERRTWYHLSHQRYTVLCYHQTTIWPVSIIYITSAPSL